ncbi:C4-dicarboxylate ABC transporter [Sporosarcina sp. P26b]|uniref:tripartite tricarboxylate transporter substrate binding protein n=1 Tax=Sporosarcina sp. P26b TaxID=2048253 RepID=UPI000C16DFF6|nr:tripartite tricarboxylate transporter substrate binding protein [Sporosarcina sp. P26b]PIC95374.1 C4-dicarboxylate ABC transporter [Sporosarcina sp. P26b]
MKKISLITLLAVLLLVVAACSNSDSSSESNETSGDSKTNFPEKNMKVIVPFAPGGAVDTINRMISKHSDEYMDGQKIIVENKEGGGAVIGQSFVAGSNPDGYTLLAFTSSAVSNPLTTETNYTHEDFEPIVMYSFEPELLVVPANSPIKSFEDFETQAKTGEVMLATPGHSTSHHTAGILLQEKFGWNINFIHTESGGEQQQQLLGGHVEAALLTYGEVQAQIKEGTIRPIAIMDKERSEEIPDTPTFKENDVDIEYGPFRGIATPKGIPEDVKEKLEKMFTGVLEDQGFIDDMEKAGFKVVYGDSEVLQSKVNQEFDFINQILPLLLEK